jgi:hypothetical protein
VPKKKERSTEEFYRGKLREADKQIRDLQRQVRSLEKTAHIPKKKDVKLPVDEPLMCPDCARGEIKILDIVGRKFHTCACCGYRKKIDG